MSYEEQEYLNGCTAGRRKWACRRAWMKQMAIQWGGWLVAGLVLMANIAVRAC